MQLFVRDAGTLTVEASAASTVHELKGLFTAKAYGVAAPDSWMLLHNGRQLPDGSSLEAAGLTDGVTLQAVGRLRGGGGDGGSTGAESRSCYLEMYMEKKPDKVNPAEELAARWTCCHLSGERLAPPCVADDLGNLFNKEAMVHALLNKSMPASLSHITSLKQLMNLKLEPSRRNAGHSSKGGAATAGVGGAQSLNEADFQCPVTGLEMNGRFKFVVHRPSGRVLAERALKDVPAAVEELLGSRPEAGDLLPLNPSGQELERLRMSVMARIEAEKGKKQAKKDKKRSAVDAAVVDGAGPTQQQHNGSQAAAAVANGSVPPLAKKPKVLQNLPPGATPEVYASLFSSSNPNAAATKETYCCRAVSGRGIGV